VGQFDVFGLVTTGSNAQTDPLPIIALFSGAQLFAIGIIGEYLARMHFRMMERPTYAIREDFQALDKGEDDDD